MKTRGMISLTCLFSLLNAWLAQASPATLPAGQATGYTQTFSEAALPDEWTALESYTLTLKEGALEVDINKGINEASHYFLLEFADPLDMSAAPFVSLDISVNRSVMLSLLLIDDQDRAMRVDQRILQSEAMTPVFIDMGGNQYFNYGSVREIRFNFGLVSFSFEGRAVMDNVRTGTHVTPFATILAIPDQFFFRDRKGAGILLHDFYHTSALTVNGGSTLIEHVTVSPVSEGTATINFDCIDGATGTDTLRVVAEGEEGFEDGSTAIRIVVEDNHPPSIDPVPLQVLSAGDDSVWVPFKGLTDNNISVDQQLTVSARSLNEALLAAGPVDHQAGMPHGRIMVNPLQPGHARVVISLEEEVAEQGTSTDTFDVVIYGSLNHPPQADHPGIQKIIIGQAYDTLYLTGLSDGDEETQNLDISVHSGDSTILLPAAAGLAGDRKAMLVVQALKTGTASLTVQLVDDGGTENNNGDQSAALSFPVNVINPTATGYVADLSDVEGDRARGLWGAGSMYQLSTVDSSQNGFYAMRVDATEKFYWDGFNLILRADGLELDLSEHPFLSMEVYPLGDNTLHWIWFYDYTDTVRNSLNNRAKRKWAEAGQWNRITFDFSGELDWRNSELGRDADRTRIARILFDMHNDEFVWPPPPDYTGSFLIRNLRVGSEAEVPRPPVTPDMDPLTIPLVFEESGEHSVALSGIHDGTGSSEGLTLEVSSSDTANIKINSVLPVSLNGTSGFTMEAFKTGLSKVTITISGGNSEDSYEFWQWVNVQPGDITRAVRAKIDRERKYQCIRGFGSYMAPDYADLYIHEMNASAVRAGLISNQIEPVNDNSDPWELNMEAMNYGAFDWEYFRRLKAGGVETFIVTSWSPPAWMKKNLAKSAPGAGQSSSTLNAQNRLSFFYYDEFAESMVALVRMFREKAGIELAGIGLQNEPAFHEPYPSAILDPEHFNKLIRVVGQRFEQEGIETMLFMPEQVFTQQANSVHDYIDKLQEDEEASRLCEVIATHGYAANGISVATPDFGQWADMWNNAREGDYPKELWMTETFLACENFDQALFIAAAIQGALVWGNVSLWTQWSFSGQFTQLGQPSSMLYAMRNFSRYVRPGAVRLHSSCDGKSLLVSAFEHEDSNTVSIVIVNTARAHTTLDLSAANLPQVYETYRTSSREDCAYTGETDITGLIAIPAYSVTTLYACRTGQLTMDGLDDLTVSDEQGEQTITVTGISDGEGGVSGLTLEAETEDGELITNLAAGAIQGDGTAELSFTPGRGLEGTTTISVTLSDGTETRIEKFIVTIESTVGLDEPEQRAFRLYPNPAGDWLTVSCDEALRSVAVIDLSGRVVRSHAANGRTQLEMPLAGLPAGTYLIRISRQDGSRAYSRFIKR